MTAAPSPFGHSAPRQVTVDRHHGVTAEISSDDPLRIAPGTVALRDDAGLLWRPHLMLRCGDRIRLTRPEAARLARISAIEPDPVHTLADLQNYARRCKAHYWERSDDTRFLRWLIDREVTRLIAGASAGRARTPQDDV